MASDVTHFDWAELAFASKKPLTKLDATFIAAPRGISSGRFKQLVKETLPNGNLILGLSKESHVAGFEDQPQFKMLRISQVQGIIAKVNRQSPNKIYTLAYYQRELNFILQKITFKKVLFVNGSWQFAFHHLPAYYTISKLQIPYQLVPAFYDEDEARSYANATQEEILATNPEPETKVRYSELDMMKIAYNSAKLSFDYNFQTGAALAKKSRGAYDFVLRAHNKVVPYETYALLHGASREHNMSPPHDLNHYDTVHAEVEVLLTCQRKGLELAGTTLFVNLLPCPPCTRMLMETEIAAVVYGLDHSEGYAIKMLEAAGKTVRRVLP